MEKTVLVIGGTGKTGGRLVKRLTEMNTVVRSASRSANAPQGVEGVAFDWFEPKGHDAAMEGVRNIYMVAPIGSSDPITVMRPFIERALSHSAQRFVLLSSSLIEEGGPAMGAVHAFLRQRAPEWAVLRPSWFMENFIDGPHLRSICTEDMIYSATGDGVVPFIAADDIANVAAHLLTEKQIENTDHVLTGPSTLSYSQVAEAIGAARSRPVRHVTLSAEALTERLQSFGIPAEFAAMLAGLDQAISFGAEARTTNSVAKLTGSAPLPFHDFAARQADRWRSTSSNAA